MKTTENYKKIKTVLHAVKDCGETPETAFPDVSKMKTEKGDYILAQTELMYIAEAINRNPDGTPWHPDYTDGQWKYDPWHQVQTEKNGKKYPSGVGVLGLGLR